MKCKVLKVKEKKVRADGMKQQQKGSGWGGRIQSEGRIKEEKEAKKNKKDKGRDDEEEEKKKRWKEWLSFIRFWSSLSVLISPMGIVYPSLLLGNCMAVCVLAVLYANDAAL